jgi:cytochrome b6-f complex iron-sulfur subunit
MPRYRNSLNDDDDNDDPKMTRRKFLAIMGWTIVGGVTGILGGAIMSFLYPNALKIPSSVFSIGRPTDVLSNDGRVFLAEHKVFMHVTRGKVRCMTAICTHLGCTVNAVETGFKCPCHGSTYDIDGKNTGGPAPRPLIFYEIYKGGAGDLVVDKSKTISLAKEAWYSPNT